MKPSFEIRGGAEPETAAAIMAAVTHLIAREEELRAHPPRPPRQPAWVLAWRPRDIPALLPSHNYDTAEWGVVAGNRADGDPAP